MERRKNIVDYQKLIMKKNYSDIPKYMKFVNKFIDLEL